MDGDATIGQVLGANIRRLRDERHETQEELARHLRLVAGLRWSQSTVAEAEAGSRDFSFEEVLILAAVLCNGDLDELLHGDGPMRLGRLKTTVGIVRLLVKSEAAGAFAPAVVTVVAAEMAGRRMIGQAEHKAARRLRCSVDDIASAAARRWHESLTERRDRLVRERVAEGASDRTIQAIRGHVTRALVEELAVELGTKED